MFYYSVADHCVIMSYNVPKEHAFAALMHDAAESYLTDVPKPIKSIMPQYQDFEIKVLEVIARKYHFDVPFSHEVKDADLRMLATEKRDLMAPILDDWASLKGVEPFEKKIRPNPPRFAEAAFLVRFQELCPDGIWL